jgi:hypothetical protein
MTDINGTRQVRAWFDLTSGTVGTVENASTATGAAASITAIGDGWYRCTITGIMNIAGQIVGFIGMAETDGVQSYLGDTGRSVLLWRPQVEVGSTTTATAYQRVTTAFDVTESGQRDCYGVRFDGTDDSYLTSGNVDFTSTNKVTVFAAIRKRSDVATAVLLELSPINTNDGTFTMAAPSLAGTNRYDFVSRGTSFVQVVTTSSAFNAPITNIVTGIGDISAPLTALRVNGTQVASSSTTQGTGNYRSDVLYIGRRNNATNPFNGDIYALIVAGGSYPLSTIQRVEKLLSRITSTVNL